jgi:hypothetical protein
VALKKPFGALNNAYYGPTMVLKTIIIFPKDIPKGQGSRATRTIAPAPGRVTQYTTLALILRDGAEVEIFDRAAPSVPTILAEGLP